MGLNCPVINDSWPSSLGRRKKGRKLVLASLANKSFKLSEFFGDQPKAYVRCCSLWTLSILFFYWFFLCLFHAVGFYVCAMANNAVELRARERVHRRSHSRASKSMVTRTRNLDQVEAGDRRHVLKSIRALRHPRILHVRRESLRFDRSSFISMLPHQQTCISGKKF